MKKFLIIAVALVGFSVAGMAQTTATTKKADATKTQVVKKTTDKTSTAKTTAVSATTKTTTAAKTNATPVKKDGTPDMRFKANQTTAKGPAKKDGTPDMRYKANKKHTK